MITFEIVYIYILLYQISLNIIFEKLLLEISGSVLKFSFFNSISNFYLNESRDYLTEFLSYLFNN